MRTTTQLQHPGSGRQALIVRTAGWLEDEPVALTGRYILIAATERVASVPAETARRWIDAGASYICAWGPSAENTEAAFDDASFLEELGTPLAFTLMTTSHADEALEEALWFGFYSAWPPEELAEPLETIVIVVDEPVLAQRCEAWVRSNRD